jgi:hypothetical protein
MTVRKVIPSVLTKVLDFKEPRVPIRGDRCERCGAGPRSTWSFIGELAAIALCGCLLLAALTIAGSAAYRWMDRINRINREGPRLLDGPAWHEPLDDWSL